MIRTAVDGDVRVITLDRPASRNALTESGLDDLGTAVEEATEPVVYIHGAGEAFCAGADIDTVGELSGGEAAEFARRGQSVAGSLATYDGAVTEDREATAFARPIDGANGDPFE